ncbi:MAG: DMT family transporter [Rhodospirillales bacterium]|nr:MAG: DMT family transporter [Rhodospirillales bacterium]
MTTAHPTTVADSGDSRRGIAWMLLTMFLFVSMDAIVKHLLQTYPVPQVAWARFFFHTVLLAAVLGRRLPATFATRRRGLQVLRSGLLTVTTLQFFGGLYFLPLAEMTAIMQSAPLLVTALSLPLLGEHVGIRRWAGVAVGFAGALIIIRPGTEAMQLAALLPLGAALTFALYQITTRILSRTDATFNTLLYTPLIGAIALSIAAPFFWVMPDLEGWVLMILTGMFGGLGHFTMIRAFTWAPAATVSPFGYSALVWAALFGLVLFGDFPDAWTIAGALVIVGSGLYILHREHMRRRHGPDVANS